MTKYIKGKDGKFAGSIGSGKTNVPNAVPFSPPMAPAASETRNARAFFGEHAHRGSTLLHSDPNQWAEDLHSVIYQSSPEKFYTEFVHGSDHYDNGSAQRHYLIHDEHGATAYLVYDRDEECAWVETWTAAGGTARSDDLSSDHAAYLQY